MAARLSPITPRRLSVGLYALATALAAVTALMVVGASRSPEGRQPQTTSALLPQAPGAEATAPVDSVRTYEALATSPVFGPGPAQAVRTPKQPAPAGDTVSAVVVGTLVRGDLSRAIVEVGTGGQKLLRVGDPLAGGRIAEITLDGVVLERDGQRVTLPVRASGRAKPAPAVAAQPSAPAPSRSVALSAPESAESPSGQTDIDSGDIELQDFDAFYGNVKKDLLAARSKTAHDVAGKPVGLALDGVAKGELLGRMGLRPGDIVTDLNDIPVTDMNSLLNAFDKVAAQVRSGNESFIVFDLVRNQKPDAVILTVWQ